MKVYTHIYLVFFRFVELSSARDQSIYIVGIGVSTPLPSKTPPLFLAKPPLNQQTVQAPPFRQSPLYIGFSRPPLKVGSFSEPQKY